ncbi:MAG: exo-alpha-sialidase [Gracilimonas sp.]
MKINGFISIILIVFVAGCISPNSNNNQNNGDPDSQDSPIRWDRSTLTKVYDGPAFYPRIIRLQDNTLMGAFESQGGVHVIKSEDDGETWKGQVEVATSRNGINAAVPELIQLQNGNLILAYNTRPPQDNEDPDRRFGIKIKISEDLGETWSEEKNIYEGGFEWNRGVWEPVMIQFLDEEIHLFFANEHPYEDSEDQEISMVRSLDNGESWNQPQTISYREGYRDGMPVPQVLQNDKGIAVAIEDNGLYGNTFKPAIVWSSDEKNWPEVITGDSPHRWGALEEEHEIAPGSYGGAPYLQQLSNGTTVLSFQTNEGRSGDWTNSRIAVSLGDEEAKNFSELTYPFDVPEGHSAMWGSLFVKNDTTVTAVTSTNAFSESGQSEFYIIDGYISPNN